MGPRLDSHAGTSDCRAFVPKKDRSHLYRMLFANLRLADLHESQLNSEISHRRIYFSLYGNISLSLSEASMSSDAATHCCLER